MKRESLDRTDEAGRDRALRPEGGTEKDIGKAREKSRSPSMASAKTPGPPVRDRGKGGMDLGL